MVILEHGIAVSPDILISLKQERKTYLFYQGNDDFGKNLVSFEYGGQMEE